MMLLIVTIIIHTASADNYKSALDTAVTATYKQTGLEPMFTTYGKNLDEKYISDEMNKGGAAAYFLLQCIDKKTIFFKWEF